MQVIQDSKLSISKCCEILLLSDRRYFRWVNWKEPGKRVPWNRIMSEEEDAILEAGRDESLCHLRAAGLMVYGHDTGKYSCSISTVQKVLKKHELAAPYSPPKRKRNGKKPDVRDLIKKPNQIYCYDGTEFRLTDGRKVQVVPILDIGSRKNLKNGVFVRSFTEQDVMDLWDDTLYEQGIDTSKLAILSDNGSQMKGKTIKMHMQEKWSVTLLYARPYTPDDNPWIEAFNRSLKYHEAKPDTFETVQDVIDWVELHRQLHNDHPHSSLGYVRPNDEHQGLGDGIRKERQNNLSVASKKRLGYYYECKAVKKESGEGLETVCNSFAVC
jgi:transposase InsO family protein